MPLRGLFLFIGVAWSVVACTGPRSVPIDAVDGGPDVVRPSARDSDFESVTEAPLTYTSGPTVFVFDPAAEPPEHALMEGGVQIEWTAGRFAVLFAERAGGETNVALRLVEGDGAAVSETVVVDDEDGERKIPRSWAMAWNDGELGVIWSKQLDGETRFRLVGRAGELRSPSTSAGIYRTPFSKVALAAADTGFALGGKRGSWIVFHWLSEEGETAGAGTTLAGGATPLDGRWSYRFEGLASCSNGQAVLWTQQGGEKDTVFVSTFDEALGVPPDPVAVHEATETVSGGALASTAKGLIASIWDKSEGVMTVELGNDGTVRAPVMVRASAPLKRPLIEAAPGEGLAMVALGGEPTAGEAGTSLYFVSLGRRSGRVYSETQLNWNSREGCVVEEFDFARAAESAVFGVVWVEICGDQRRMFFARVTGG